MAFTFSFTDNPALSDILILLGQQQPVGRPTGAGYITELEDDGRPPTKAPTSLDRELTVLNSPPVSSLYPFTASSKTGFVCDVCDASFPVKKSLNRHSKTVHGPGIFRCYLRAGRFKRKDILERHLDEQHNETAKTVLCAGCGRSVCPRYLPSHKDSQVCQNARALLPPGPLSGPFPDVLERDSDAFTRAVKLFFWTREQLGLLDDFWVPSSWTTFGEYIHRNFDTRSSACVRFGPEESKLYYSCVMLMRQELSKDGLAPARLNA